LVFQAQRLSDNQFVILKLLDSEYPSFNELIKFRHQYIITQNLNIPGIVQPLALEKYHNSLILVMPDEGYISLADYLQNQSLSLTQCLKIGIKLTEILQGLYHNRIIHKDIKPANILIHPKTLDIQLIDFSIASLLPKETQIVQNPNILEGTLAYISPEQTGRMNRGIDYRSDFYSLGITLYELLTGSLPFETTDAMELVHCHIAKIPAELGEEVPKVVSNIVMKLIAKNAEDRYQSAWGIQKDLETCLKQLEKTGNIEKFDIGKQDICDQFNIPEKLYGRSSQVKQLLETFNRISGDFSSVISHSPEKHNEGHSRSTLTCNVRKNDKQQSEMMLVAGYSGVGKTAVVNEVHKPIIKQRGYFIKGKFDQFNRNIPLSAFVQALRDLMSQLLSENDSQLQQWKSQILAAVGENGQVIIEVIPELEKVIGSQSPVAELSGTAAQNRFNLLFQKFIQVFATAYHPLVIFLDDLQWADSASLNLIKLLMSEANQGYLLLIGAYRDNEVNLANPLMLTLNEIQKNQIIINTITLTPLHQHDLNQLIADTLHCSLQQASPLTQAVYQKTKGNPFFATQFLKALYEDGLIYFNPQECFWQCDLAKVKLAAVGEDVVEFVSGRLHKLSSLTQDVLKFAACIGHEFDLATLAIVRQTSELETANNLWQALKEGLILPTTETYKFYTDSTEEINLTQNKNHISVSYKFLHDRIQQASYSLIPEDKKQKTHLTIGRLLQQNLSEAAREEKLFDIVEHFNCAQTLIISPQEREALAQLNLEAGQKARNSTAYLAARNFIKVGLELLSINCWETQYELTLKLYIAAAETAYLNADFEEMEMMSAQVLQSAQTLLDKVKIYEIKISALTAQSQIKEAIILGHNILMQLGVEFAFEADEELTNKALQTLAQQLQGQQIEELIHLPVMKHTRMSAAMKLLAMLFSPIFIASPALLPLLCSKMVSLSLQFGNAPASTMGYIGYGMVLSAFSGDIKTGYRFGQVALNILNQLDAREYKSLTLLWFAAALQHRQEPLRATLSTTRDSYLTGIETGDFLHAGYSIARYIDDNFFAGVSLDNIAIEIEKYCPLLISIQQNSSLVYLKMKQQMVQNWIEFSDKPDIIRGINYDETVMLPKHYQENDYTAYAVLYIFKLILAYTFGRYNLAQEYITQAHLHLAALAGTLQISIFYFYASLTSVMLSSKQSGIEQENTLILVEKYQVILADWADSAPMNHQHKINLVEAEKCRVLDKKLEAMELYDKAISGAKENKYLQEEALANELAAKFYLEWGKEKFAQTYMIEAYYCYAHWGAKAKTKDLEQRYPQLLAPILEQQKISLNPFKTIASLGNSISHTQATNSSNTTGISEALDFTSIIKASQALSSEIELNQLLTHLMQVMIENAGATKGVLILSQESQLTVEAVSTHNYNEEDYTNLIKQSIPVEESLDIPQSIINSVKRSLKPLNIEQVSSQTQLASDPYFLQQHPQSLLCLPLKNRGQLLGILYLENNLTIAAFTEERIEVLKLLCSQAAISIENAQLYQNSQ
ncbi:MAG: AAA family ATPase, partial [Microcoleaceae cyanobacterium]